MVEVLGKTNQQDTHTSTGPLMGEQRPHLRQLSMSSESSLARRSGDWRNERAREGSTASSTSVARAMPPSIFIFPCEAQGENVGNCKLKYQRRGFPGAKRSKRADGIHVNELRASS